MLLKTHSLRQIDEAYIRGLPREEVDRLSVKLLNDLKEAHERLNQNPSNSSVPPSARAPWLSNDEGAGDEDEDEDEALEGAELPHDDDQPAPSEDGAASAEAPQPPPAPSTGKAGAEPKRKPGRQHGAPGHGRTQHLAVTKTVHHRARRCAACEQAAPEDLTEHRAWTGFYCIDIVLGEPTRPGLTLTNTLHRYYDLRCRCGHVTREAPYRAPRDGLWEDVGLTEWRLVGPMLCALIVALTYRSRMSRARAREFLRDWLGLSLSVGTLQRCIEESGRAAEPVEEQLVEAVLDSGLLHADETTHKENGQALWLWVFVNVSTTLFYIGHRTREIVENLLGDGYTGWLMSDGYVVYRAYLKRLRCWAHLQRKAKGLEDSLEQAARGFGRETGQLLSTLMAAVYRAREGPPGEDLTPTFQKLLDAFRATCEQMESCSHDKTRELACEFLNDWDAIFAVLAHPHLPLTNNEAERALRHWVIWRRISYGTRTPVGSRTMALLASIIDTCRRRGVSPWPYLAEVIAAGRQGRAVPQLPAAA